MNKQTDQQLLATYAASRSESAFAELVRRQVDLVYSAALRMVCDTHLAEDVTQKVFVALAKNAGQLAGRPVLSGWLHRTAQNLAANTVRSEVRRRHREQEATAMNELLSSGSDADWTSIAHHLDAGLGNLDETDRDALLLRYFEKKSAREMADLLGISEDAAQKRVGRAVEKLREFFSKQKVTIGAGGLVGLISANAVQSAPVGLSAAILTAATAGTTTTTLGTTMIHKLLIAGLTAAVAGTGLYTAHLQKRTTSLAQQQASLAQAIQQLNHERNEAQNQLVILRQQNEQLSSNTELLQLRAEVGRLKNQQNAGAAVMPTTVNASNPPSPASMGHPALPKQIAITVAFVITSKASHQAIADASQHNPEMDIQSSAFSQFIGQFSDAKILDQATILVTNDVARAYTNVDIGDFLRIKPNVLSDGKRIELAVQAGFQSSFDAPQANRSLTMDATVTSFYWNLICLQTETATEPPDYLLVLVKAQRIATRLQPIKKPPQ